MQREEISKEEYSELIKEAIECRQALIKTFGVYTANAIDRLIMVRTRMDQVEVKTPKRSTRVREPTGIGKQSLDNNAITTEEKKQ